MASWRQETSLELAPAPLDILIALASPSACLSLFLSHSIVGLTSAGLEQQAGWAHFPLRQRCINHFLIAPCRAAS